MKFSKYVTLLVMVLFLGVTAFAQDTTAPAPKPMPKKHHAAKVVEEKGEKAEKAGKTEKAEKVGKMKKMGKKASKKNKKAETTDTTTAKPAVKE